MLEPKQIGDHTFSLGFLLSKDITEPEWLIENFILKNGIHFLVGQSGTAKTMIAIYLSLLGLTQGSYLFNKFEVKEPLRIAYLDKENGKNRFALRVKLLIDGNEIDLPDETMYIYNDMDELLLDDNNLDLFQMLIQDKNINLLVIDSFLRYSSIDENTSSESNKVYSFLKKLTKLGLAILIIHHTNKSGSMRGSSDFTAFSDIVFIITKNKQSVFNINNNSALGGKMRDGPDMEQISFKLIDKTDEETGEKGLEIRMLSETEMKQEQGKKADDSWNSGDYDVEVVNILKEEILLYFENKKIKEYSTTKDLIPYLMQSLDLDKKTVQTNLYGERGAHKILLNENYIKQIKRGHYKVLKF